MFEAHVLHLLRRYLGEYVHGLSTEALRISVWKGDVVLKDLKLKAEALNSLKLPVTVKAGFVGTITLKVPWKSLGKEPVIVLIDRVFILANPAPDGRTLKEEDREKLLVTKLQQIEEAESATLEAIAKSKLGSAPSGNSWLGSLIATIIGNLKISISNVHIRYEDSTSNPGHPFAAGITLAKLAAVTMDEEGNETFDTSGALDKLRKSLQLERLALYHDSNSCPWEIEKKWEDLSPEDWVEIFEDGIKEQASDPVTKPKWALSRQYILSPINGVLKYHRLGNLERNNPEIPFERASLVLTDVNMTITEDQYHDWIKLVEVVSRYKTYIEVSHLRPMVPVLEAPYLWWRYAAQASLQQKKLCYRFSWDHINRLCQLRRRYVQLYANLLQHSSNANYIEMREIEKDLDSKVILLWRLLAHAKLESMKSKEAAEQRKLKKAGWFSFSWRTEAEDDAVDSAAGGSQLMEGRLTKEEWQAVNKLLSHQPDEEIVLYSGKDMQHMTHFLVTVSIGQGAAKIIDINQTEMLCGRFEQLDVTTKFKHRSTQCDVSLRFYGLSAPEGSLAQSVSSENKANALVASFVNSPIGENIDWRLSATISPCHATIWAESCDRVLEFVKRSNAVSPTVVQETATVLQMKLEEVTRRAQEQLQTVLEEQSRFALDIDLDAPKVRIPLRAAGSSKCDSHFLLDFGNFTLTTMDSHFEEKRQNLYSRFYISGRDIAAFFTDCGSHNHGCSLLMEDFNNQPILSPILEKADNMYSLIDRCGMAVIVDQIKVPHPSYPSTRISIQVPNLSVHFSPTRYLRIMQLFNILCGAMKTCGQPPVDNLQDGMRPWGPTDLASGARILVWKGIGNSVATWQPCYIALSVSYLYAFESERSLVYQRYLSMAGRQVFEVPPANVGGSPYCLAVGLRGMDLKKALESSSTWIIEFQGEEEKTAWLRGLISATYQASAPLSVDVLGQTSDDVADFHEPQTRTLKTADLVINGALVETKLFIYGKIRDEADEKVEEVLLLEVLASGGKVHLISSGSGLTVRTKLHSLKVKDELQHQLSGIPQYLAYSVLKNDNVQDLHGACDFSDKEKPVGSVDDEDAFTDALPEFLSPTDPSTPDFDMIQCSMMLDCDECAGFESAEGLINEKGSQGKGLCDEVFYEAQGGEFYDFISVVFLTRSTSSPDYDGIDTQMSICMSKLEFFCNRPTVVALIGFGFDMSDATYRGSSKDVNTTTFEKSDSEKEKNDESGRVEGLLGYGKDRVVFYLNMNVDSVTVFLNKEDGSQLAMFVQERFVLDIKVHPSSLSIEGTLGNFKLCDKSLDTENCWSWLCDIRDPGVESLIKFKFNSYSAGDDDYEGYDYSLSGRLSAVRIVFLYRFVQEVTAYFMGLASPHTEEVIKLVDKVGGFEWLIQKYEIDGATALKLDLSLDTPVIVVPRDSTSKDYIQLDVGQLEVSNEISWHGCPEKDPSAVRVDVLHATILGLNMSVGISGCIGQPMIREGQGLDIFVRRSLRDVFKKVPTFSLEVKIDFLHGVMSDKEYDIIVNCSYMNLCEEPKLPPDFRGGNSGPNDQKRLLIDKVNFNDQMVMSSTVTIVEVDINYALLELRNSANEESPLAHVALEGLWVSYRMTSLSETDLYISVPKFSILDIRPNTKPEMRLMLGSSVDASKQASLGSSPFSLSKGSFKRVNSRAVLDVDAPNSTMLLMDYRWRASSQSCVLRVQQPRILAVPDFLLAVCEFFVPALRAITGRDETMDPKNDPITRNNSIVLSEPLYKQTEDVVYLSPSRQLVADSLWVGEYTYDGCGKCISLSEQGDKDLSADRLQPIIIVGHGKKLRFVNVTIKNGSLLRKCIYLSNDSSCLLSPEDGVDISVVEKSNPDNPHSEAYVSSDAVDTSQDDSNSGDSFTFEAQVVSPEFTFFDGAKSSLDDSSSVEKLLRMKMDFSFMYASKENDIWVRSLLKDLMVETGSGLIILDPVDISGGYTSVKEKTNMSLISTDIYIHLSLSALSLLLNLQSQVAGALQSGNTAPLAPCTNFDRIWVSPKENGPMNNLTIWRPRAPSNYVILGDCVTSRAIPPAQAVMAVCNTYGRVRKPIGFDRIGLFSVIQGLGGASGNSSDDNECSLWMPVAPDGYIAMGCVANLGTEPPDDHVVYCLRSDLVSSSSFSECIYTVPSNSLFKSGFSIWRIDNVLGSFYAHSSTDTPSKEYSCGLSHCLFGNLLPLKSSPYVSDPPVSKFTSHKTSDQSGSSSGWDILRSISKATNYYVSTPNFERIWWDKGGDLRRPVSVWRPVSRPGYAILGDCITEGFEPPALGILFKADDTEIAAKPVQFTKVAHIAGKGLDEVFCWYPVSPPGYVSLGCVLSKIDEAPPVDLFCCPRIDLVNQANIYQASELRSSGSKSSQYWSIWKVENQACTFLVRSDLKKPSSRLAFAIGESVKPKTRDNVNTEIKLRCLSLTLLDGLHGMMTPLFDTTVTNIKLATHGRPEAMNAVLISSIAASTFNPQLEAWEPLLEPFDGLLKLETYDTGLIQSSKPGKRVRIAATSTLNINVSAANLETLGDAVVSWRRQLELEDKAAKKKEEACVSHGNGSFPAFSAIDEDDFQTITVENKLGCDLYLKKLEENSDVIVKLCHGENTSVWVPPPRFSNRLNVADSYKAARHYMTIQILEAKGLHIVDDGNSHNFFCALRLVVDSQGGDSQRLFPQSARTKCVKPSSTIINNLLECNAKWNELFIFEIPRKGSARLEVEVTNLAAKAGKGEVVGSLSFPVGYGANMLRKVASVRVLHQSNDAQNTISYPLRRKNAEEIYDNGFLFVSTFYFEKSPIANTQRNIEDKEFVDGDTGFWIGVHPDESWHSIRSLLPLSVAPKSFQNDFIAMEVSIKNGRKHATFRGLATVANDLDINLEISLSSGQNISSGESNHKAFIAPRSSYVLPWGCLSKDNEQCLHFRPGVEHPHPPYVWGCCVAVSTGCGKDQPFVDQGLLTRQNTLKQGSKASTFALKLNQLEKKDMLFCCQPCTGSKPLWLSIGIDASVLHTDLNAPVYDWKIAIHSPLKLENRLPCPAKFTVWEKTKEGTYLERQHGTIYSRKSAHIYSADIQRPVYLTLLVQGGWVLEKDPVLVLDLASNDNVSSFWLIHQQSKRRLRVSIERDMGETGAAPKTIRFFVPYWITNDTYLCLAYRVVEIEPSENMEADSSSLSRASKSFKRNPTFSMDKRQQRKNIRVLEVIEDTSPMPSMLSPQESAGRSGVVLFPSQKDSYLSPRVGIAVAVRDSEIYSPGISLLDLEKKERIDVKAFCSDVSYYKLSAILNMTSDRTKVIHLQPHTLFINRVGLSICLQQCDSQTEKWIHPSDPPKLFGWQSSARVELLKLRVNGYGWSTPFSVFNEGVMRVSVGKEDGTDQLPLRVQVRSGTKNSRYEVIFRPNSISSPYRIENRSMFLPMRYRQVDGNSDSWQFLLPNAAASFYWEDLGRRHLLELLVDGIDPSKSEKYDIDEIGDHLPRSTEHRPTRAIRVTILKEDKRNVVRISDWMPAIEHTSSMNRRLLASSLSKFSVNESQQAQLLPPEESEFHVIVELAELGVSVIDHAPEEILYVSVQSLFVAYSTGLGSGLSRFKVRMQGIQVDNQLPLTPMPVLFRPQRTGDKADCILKFSVTLQSNASLDLRVYPYIGFHGPENAAFLINIHEPIIWRIHEMIRQANLTRLSDSQSTAVSVDPFIQIGVLNISEVRFKVSMAMSPSQRPRGVLGFWSSLMTALGNTENMQVRISERFNEKISMRQSTMINNAVRSIKKDILGQPLQLLSGVDILGNASSALGHMSQGIAALSMDKKFIQSRQRQENKGIEDFGDIIREGGGAFAKGLFRGVTGILTKPLEGAKSSGVEGFVSGVGKGIIGAAAQPVSGVLDLLSKTTEGANAMRMKIAAAITSDEQLLRRRLPRVIGADSLLRPYNEYRAQGQVILQLAESGSFLGQVDLFKVRGKFALSDAYENHFMLPKGKILMITHRRVILLQQPSNIMGQRKFIAAKDACSILWDVLWDELMTMEVTKGKKDNIRSPPSRLIIYLKTKPHDSREQIRVVKCSPNTNQASEVYAAIDQAINTYGENGSKGMVKNKVKKPYSPNSESRWSEGAPQQQQVAAPLTLSSTTFGTSSPT